MVLKRIYLDYNSTTPLLPEVIGEMEKYIRKYFGNPSSGHWAGYQPKSAVEKARKQVANLLNCAPEEIVFTSGGTESNNLAIKGVAWARKNRGNHIITTQIEHPAVLEVCRYLEKHGFQVTYLPVDKFGIVHPKEVAKAITPKTILVTVMHANNEVGTIQPIEEISKITKKHGVLFHTDAAQSVGKIATDVRSLGVDLLSVAGHKLYGPKGVGALYVKDGIKLEKFIHGAGQEHGARAGTENVIEIVGLGQACEIAARGLRKNSLRLKKMRDEIYERIKGQVPEVRLNGHPQKRLPNTLSLSFRGVRADVLISEMGPYLAISAGAACHSGKNQISYILKAMNIPEEWALGTVRISLGRFTNNDEIKKSINLIVKEVKKINSGQNTCRSER